MVRAVRKQYIRQIFINFLFIVIVSIVVCPVLIPPIPGYLMTGVLAELQMNVVLPLVLMTHSVILVALTILQLVKHQLTTLSDLRFTKKFDIVVKLLQYLFLCCYFLMVLTALAILPALTLIYEEDNFRREAYEIFHNPLVFCPDMFTAHPLHWKIVMPYTTSVIFGLLCSVTGVFSVMTCLFMIYESRKFVSKETMTMQRNFTIALIYQALVYIVFIICPVAIISAEFLADVPLPENGLYYLLLITAQGAVNCQMHIVPAMWRAFRCKKELKNQRNSKDMAMWSTTASFVVAGN